MAVSTPVNTGYTIINGTTTGSNGSKVNTWIEYKVTSQDVVANTSTIRVILYSQATWDSGTGHVVTGNYGYVKVDSSQPQYYSMSGGYNFENKKLNKFADATFTVTHGTDGKKTATISGAWSDIKSDGKPYSTYISGGSVSASVTLPQIARASTVSSLSATLGTAGTITITRQDSSFTHTLQYSFDNSSWTNIATGVGASYSWAPSVNLISSFSNSKTKTGYIRCITYSGGTQVGTSTNSLTLTAPSSSLANVTGTYGTALTLTATNACASGLTYTFQYHDGSAWTSIASGVTGKTRSWTPATSLIANVNNASTGTISIRVITYVGTATVNTATATATLTIPKNTSSARSGTIGSALSIPITKAHSKLTSTITYSFGSKSNVIIVEKTTSTSYSWTPSTSLLTEIPSATIGVGIIKIESFNGTKSLGSNTYDLTLAVANNVVPTISFDAPVRVNNNATVESWGIYLQGYSAVKLKLRANGVSGSTISRMSITGQGISSASTPGTSSPYLETTSSIFGAAGTFSYTGAATDSRGRSASEARSSNVVVQAYSSPSVTNTRIVRCDSNGTENTAGTSLKVTLNSSYTQVGQNAFTAHLQYKRANDTSWTTVTATAIDPSTANVFNLGLSAQQNYNTRIRYSDSLSGYQYTTEISIPSDERIINVNASGKGLAIGGFSTDAGKLQVYYPADFEGSSAPTFNSSNNITYYTDTHITATNYNSIEAFYDALPSSVQTSVWCETATDRPMASGGMVTVFKEDNSYGYVVFHGTGGHYFTKRKTGGVWQQWFAMAFGSISGNDITLSQKLIGNFTGNFTSWQSFAYSVSGNIKSNWKGFLKTAIDNLQSQLANGSYVIQLSWSGQTWGQAYVTISNDVPYAMLKWMPPFEGWFSCAYYNGGYNYKYVPTTTDNRIFDAYGSTKQLTSGGTITLHSISLPQGVYLFEGFASPTAISGDQKFELYFPTMATHREGVWSRSNTIVYMNIQSVIAISSDNTSIAMDMYSSPECTIANIHMIATALYLGNP